jgi:hypothetical protein
MYEEYVGKAANITLSDGRFVKGTIIEVLDAVGSMKLSDGKESYRESRSTLPVINISHISTHIQNTKRHSSRTCIICYTRKPNTGDQR